MIFSSDLPMVRKSEMGLTVAILEEDLTLKSSFQTIFAHFGGVKINEFR